MREFDPSEEVLLHKRTISAWYVHALDKNDDYLIQHIGAYVDRPTDIRAHKQCTIQLLSGNDPWCVDCERDLDIPHTRVTIREGGIE